MLEGLGIICLCRFSRGCVITNNLVGIIKPNTGTELISTGTDPLETMLLGFGGVLVESILGVSGFSKIVDGV